MSLQAIIRPAERDRWAGRGCSFFPLYEHLLDTMLPTALLALGLAWLACALAGKAGFALRLLAYNFVPAIAAAFFLVAPSAQMPVNPYDVFSGFLFEFVVLCLFCRLFVSMVRQVRTLPPKATQRALKVSLLLQLAFAAPLLSAEGFGIFSEGSRIEYLYAGSAAKYFTYAGILISAWQAGLMARRVSEVGRLRGFDFAVLGLNFAASVLAGSKGGFFLWLLAVLALIDYRAARISRSTAIVALLTSVVAFVGMSAVVTDFLGVTFGEFLQLGLSRFFLTNDARALAYDLRPIAGSGVGLMSESFRSIAALFGSLPSDPPLGIHLYEYYFGASDGNGANASLIALITFYSSEGYALLPALLAVSGAIVLYRLIKALHRSMHNLVSRFAITVWGAVALQLLSQDFLAFQVVLPLITLAVVLLFVLDRRPAIATPRRVRNHAAPLTQHHHPGA